VLAGTVAGENVMWLVGPFDAHLTISACGRPEPWAHDFAASLTTGEAADQIRRCRLHVIVTPILDEEAKGASRCRGDLSYS
jgi:hypothetical protein